MGLLLTFYFENRFKEISLPAIDNRRITLTLEKELFHGNADLNVNLEVWDGIWYLAASPQYGLADRTTKEQVRIEPGEIRCRLKEERLNFTILIEKFSKGQSIFHKYRFGERDGVLSGEKKEITIGKDPGCDIVYKSSYVSSLHATISREKEGYHITDSSKNGTYLNGIKINARAQLHFGDIIYILGMKIVFLGDMIAFNKKEDIADCTLMPYAEPADTEKDETDHREVGLYRRSARNIEPYDSEPVEIEAPPPPDKQRSMPLIFIVGPSVTMPIPILLSVLVGINSQTGGSFNYMGTILSVVLAAVIGLGWALANHLYNKKQRAKDEEIRVTSYRQYISKITSLLHEKHARNAAVADKRHPETKVSLTWPQKNDPSLWNRNINHSDFLIIRLGLGNIPFQAPINIPKERFSLINDPLAEEPYRLMQEYRYLHNGPVSISIKNNKIIGVIGNEKNLIIIARLLAGQVAALHSYTDVKMVFLHKNEETQVYEWSKWLPHVWTDDHKTRMTAGGETEQSEIIFILSSIIRDRIEMRASEGSGRNAPILPHYVIFITAPEIIENEAICKYLFDEEDYGITTILLFGGMDRLPNQCRFIIQNDEEFSGYYLLTENRDEDNKTHFDIVRSTEIQRFSRSISGYFVKEMSQHGEIPASITFLGMYGVGRVEKIDVLKNWKENRTYESMRALIGYKSGNNRIWLDIHEKQHGPHGLIAGTTGSGKSELIQTYILSLALNYHPNEIAFILIDYKGGGMANAFEKLPHVAGTITNLGGNQTNRALSSIKSEIKRRQAIFATYGVNHIDQYARLYREGSAGEALPHLVIIADEFAELKKEQPDFMKELVSTARVGRSLGVHLILATQKPAGVVDDEIWSNARFKLCLKVQDKQDSHEMLKRPEAAFITLPGRGYMQVGNDEIFELFQSGYSGGQYEAMDEIIDKNATEVTMIDTIGRPAVLKAKKKTTTRKETELAATVKHIGKVAVENGIQGARQLWYLPLPDQITLEQLKGRKERAAREDGKYHLRALVGLVDDPANQRQENLYIDLARDGHLMIAGLTGSGKSVFVQTLLYSIITQYTPEDVNIYIMDFSSRITITFDVLPHVGGVVFSDDAEKVNRVIRMVLKEIEERKKRFVQKGVNDFAGYKAIYDDHLPAIMLVIDNFAVVSENYEKLVESIIKISREGLGYGIYMVVTGGGTGGLPGKIRQNIRNAVCLQMNEMSDYHDVLGQRPPFAPAEDVRGRGLVCYPDPVEFQTALCCEAANDYERTVKLKTEFEGIAKAFNGIPAKRIPVIPEKPKLSDMLELNESKAILKEGMLPLGYDAKDAFIVPVDLHKTFCYIISDATTEGRANLLKNLAYTAAKAGGEVHIVDGYKKSLDTFARKTGAASYINDEAGMGELADKLGAEFKTRFAGRKEYLNEHGENCGPAYAKSLKPIFIFIENFGDFCDTAGKGQSRVRELYEAFFKQGAGLNIYFIAGFDASTFVNHGIKEIFRNFILWKTGIHIGGKVDQQRLLEISLPFSEQSKSYDWDTAHIPDKPEGRMLRLPGYDG